MRLNLEGILCIRAAHFQAHHRMRAKTGMMDTYWVQVRLSKESYNTLV